MQKENQTQTPKNEYELQCSIISYLKDNYPKHIVFSVPNEAAKNRWPHYQNSGALSGAPDLVVITSLNVFFVECKYGKNTQTLNQQLFEGKVNGLGFNYYVVYSLDEFILALKQNQSITDIYKY